MTPRIHDLNMTDIEYAAPTLSLDKDGQPYTKRLSVGTNQYAKEGCPSLSGDFVTLAWMLGKCLNM